MPYPKFHQPGIVLIAGTILTIVTLLAGVTVFVVMQRHAEALLRTFFRNAGIAVAIVASRALHP